MNNKEYLAKENDVSQDLHGHWIFLPEYLSQQMSCTLLETNQRNFVGHMQQPGRGTVSIASVEQIMSESYCNCLSLL